MRVCFVCNEYPPAPHGGIGTLTRVLAHALTRAGHEVRVIGAYSSGVQGVADQDDHGVLVRRLAMASHRGGWLRTRYALYRHVAKWVARREVDIVEVPDYEGWAAGWPRLPVPVITRLSGSGTYFEAELGRRARLTTRWLERAALRRADFWIAESDYVFAKTVRVFGLRPPPHVVLYNPVPVPPEVPFRHRAPARVVFAGTLTWKKGIVSLAKAWPGVVASCSGAELHVYGKDLGWQGRPMRQHLLDLMGPAATSVRFYGRVTLDELVRAFQEARVTVLPSYAEGFALTPLHAMAAGSPTIYTRRSSGRELVQHEENGLLVDPDHPEEIAESIISVLRDDELAERLSRAGRASVVERFSPQVIGVQNERFYSQCVNAFQGRQHAVFGDLLGTSPRGST